MQQFDIDFNNSISFLELMNFALFNKMLLPDANFQYSIDILSVLLQLWIYY